jgi:hypothetical protein
MTMPRVAFAFLALLLFVAGCQPDPAEPDARPERAADDRPAADGPDAIADAIGQMFGGGGEGGRVTETVDFRALRDLLPEDLRGFERTDAGGEKTGMGGFNISRAEGDYRDADDPSRRIELQITDAGGFGRMMMFGATWMQMEVDRESSTGYERTTKFEGYPALEKFQDTNRPRSELQLVVGDRFFVSADGQNVAMDELKAAVRAIDLDELEDMRDVGVVRE